MYQYVIGDTLIRAEKAPPDQTPGVVLVTSEELQPLQEQKEGLLRHTPLARDVRVSKAEVHHEYLCGSVVTPRKVHDEVKIAFGFLVSTGRVVLCDDSGAVHSLLKRMEKERLILQGSTARFLYTFFEQMLSRDLHHLQELEDRLDDLEEKVIQGSLDGVNAELTSLHRQAMPWLRYYSQLDDMVCELEENENGFFTESDQSLFHLLEKRVSRLLDETKLLREYYVQVREMYQSQIEMQQNQIMKVLTIVTTVAMPLTILVGWYGMNFSGMPELSWKYGYPAVIITGILILLLTIWWVKKKKFW